MKHAYVVFPDQQTADAVVEHAGSNPMELNGRQLIIRHYTEPPNHVPKGIFVSLCPRSDITNNTGWQFGFMVAALYLSEVA